jgi:hypothetical protein
MRNLSGANTARPGRREGETLRKALAGAGYPAPKERRHAPHPQVDCATLDRTSRRSVSACD